jgi:hypothetical protein
MKTIIIVTAIVFLGIGFFIGKIKKPESGKKQPEIQMIQWTIKSVYPKKSGWNIYTFQHIYQNGLIDTFCWASPDSFRISQTAYLTISK